MGRIHFGEVPGGLCPMGDTLKQGKSVRSPPPEEEVAAETMHYELMTDSLPTSLCHCGRGREAGIKLNL